MNEFEDNKDIIYYKIETFIEKTKKIALTNDTYFLHNIKPIAPKEKPAYNPIYNTDITKLTNEQKPFYVKVKTLTGRHTFFV